MGKPHVVAIPLPAQGHVTPLLALMQSIVTHINVKITFVNTDFNHKRFVNALSEEDNLGKNRINFVSIPDGLEPWDDRNDLLKLGEAIFRVMPGKLEELIGNINLSDEEKVTCVIYDMNMGWVLDVAKNMQIKGAAFWVAAIAQLAEMFNIPKMIDDGIIDTRGKPIKDRMIQLAPAMPLINTKNLAWTCLGDSMTEQNFQVMVKNNESAQSSDMLICNSCYELEPAAFSLIPNILPIGPLSSINRQSNLKGNFWPEDSSCLDWLDQQRENSVIYVAFGSFTIFDNTQFKELALGLELTNMPFLWVVRRDTTDDVDDAYPKGFKERVATRGRTISWAPQQAVLSHRSVACFLSHCGWNSTIEGVSSGVPFLCWPYFSDHFLGQSYICDVWKVGLGFDKDENGIIRQEEIKGKVENLLTDKSFKKRATYLKESTAASVERGGHSHENLNKVIEWMKE